MAASNLRVTRRPKGSPARRSLTAASQPIDDPVKQLRGTMVSAGRGSWQVEAWDLLDEVGELRYYVGWRAGSCSRVRLVASEIDEETGLPTGGIDEDSREAQRVAEIVRAIAGGPLGQAQMLKRLAECLTVPGEVYLAILVRDDGEHWLPVTREEMKAKPGGGTDIEMPSGEMHHYNPGVDALIRIWNPRPRRAKEADSPVRACLDPLREIVRTSKKIKNASKSRLMGNGVLILPQEMSLPAPQAPLPAGQAQLPGAPVPVVQGVPAAEQLNNLLYNTAKVAVEDEDSQAAFIPIIVTAPGDQIKNVQHIKLGNDVTEVEIKTRNDAIARLAMGLDVSPERLLGLGTNSNHWSAWQIGDEDVQLHISPVIETICAAINREVMRIVLAREGIDPEKYILWYDASQLTVDPDKTDEATAAKEAGAINNEAYRRYLGLGDEDGYDFSTLDGWKVWAQDAVAKNPELIVTLLPLLDANVQALDFPQPQALPAGGNDPNAEEEDDSGADQQSEPNTEDDAEAAAALTRPALPAEMILAERMLVTRALELAGKRRANTNALKSRLSGLPAHDYHRVLGPVPETDIARLTSGWDIALEDHAISMLGLDTEELRARARQAIRRELTAPVIDAEVS
ncbi:portal protein [Mycobacterium phage Quesadilla]|uniref:Portal protein n=1 Tax=Mycobacterium phage Quesadilla TaxID=2664226 RepID=A0A5Q2WEZ4_9CAUD|nr:portal protein [Mycobacterium phage Quesadilla]QGH75259.1 portal protein [Mycobacterium phage Quesadilla]